MMRAGSHVMVQLPKITGIIALLTVLPAPALASVAVSGTYRGEIGQIDLQTRADGRVTGRYTGHGACPFDPNRPILDGELEGKVLVATITLCQQGPACNERPYNILAFYDSSTGSLVADVKLEAGCDSPALKNARLVLRLAKAEEVQPAAEAPPVKKGKRQEECRSALEKGKHLLERRDYAGAAYYFDRGLVCDQRNWAAHLALGIAELRRGDLSSAVGSLEKARDLAHAANQADMDVYYNLACANARQGDRASAYSNLKKALELGFADPETMGTDPDLVSIRDEPLFKSLTDQAWERKHREAKKGE
jgi:tetratricopeptide (TPR) repeat protein